MTATPEKTLDKMFEYNLWANTSMIELCKVLDDEQLAFETEGAYGGIHSFLAHIVRSEGVYIRHLTGALPWESDINWDNLPLDTLLEHAQLTGQRLIDIASKSDADGTIEYVGNDGRTSVFYNWTVLAQAFSHSMEHRTHIKVLLTQLGIEHQDFSVWRYMDTLA